MNNQCQGCQAGWPIIKKNLFVELPWDAHKVSGGYEGEIVACTADLYTEITETTEKTNDTGTDKQGT